MNGRRHSMVKLNAGCARNLCDLYVEFLVYTSLTFPAASQRFFAVMWAKYLKQYELNCWSDSRYGTMKIEYE